VYKNNTKACCRIVEGRGEQFGCKVQLNSCPKAISINCFVIRQIHIFWVRVCFQNMINKNEKHYTYK